MRTPTNFKLVNGFHPETPIPRDSQRFGWKHRVALVQDSHVPELPEMFFDAALLVHVLTEIDRLIAAPTCRVKIHDPKTGKSIALTSIDALKAFYVPIPEDDRDLPDEILWLNGPKAIAGGFPEKWHAIGGPEIYHDSFTFSVFSQEEIFAALRPFTEKKISAKTAKLTAVLTGKIAP